MAHVWYLTHPSTQTPRVCDTILNFKFEPEQFSWLLLSSHSHSRPLPSPPWGFEPVRKAFLPSFQAPPFRVLPFRVLPQKQRACEAMEGEEDPPPPPPSYEQSIASTGGGSLTDSNDPSPMEGGRGEAPPPGPPPPSYEQSVASTGGSLADSPLLQSSHCQPGVPGRSRGRPARQTSNGDWE